MIEASETMQIMKDIHLPDSLLWWPPAPGWWLLMLIGLFVMGLRHQRLKRKRQSDTSPKDSKATISEALQLLEAIPVNPKNNRQTLKEISVLLRRAAMSLYGRDNVAGLTGETWLKFLDDTGKTDAFTQGKGRMLIKQPYLQSNTKQSSKKQLAHNTTQLIAIIKQWLHTQNHKQEGLHHV